MKRFFSLIFALFLLFSLQAANAETIKSVLMPGKVIQGHIKQEDNCENCHKHFDKAAQSTLCADCHKEVKKDIAEKRGFHGKQETKKECRECHTEHKGRGADIVNLNEKIFKHNQTDYPLKGAHAGDKVDCKDCHKPKIKWRDAPGTCIACHKKDDKHKNSLGEKCADCHTEKDWKEIKFNHDKSDFPLKGAHANEEKVKCNDCHKDTRFKETPNDCYSCHKKDDEHKGVFGPKCESCHEEKDWKTTHFNHETDGHFALRGAHDKAKCDSCHKAFKEDLPKSCIGCHRSDDVHKGSLGDKCDSCHNERTWSTSNFDHDKTKFPLRDKHKTKCESCHKTGKKFEKVPMDCMSCHEKDDTHKGKFGVKCQDCHDAKDWKKSTFNHDRDTKYKLKDKHKTVKCESCHKGHLYNDKVKSDCYSCHKADDVHKGAEGTKCQDCHTEATWKVKDFDHNKTKFPLLGKHFMVECKKCHDKGSFKEAKSDCWSCHKKDDVHKQRLGTLCADCHNARDWKIWDYDHAKRANYKLEGGHSKVACEDCHTRIFTGKVFASRSCVSCHSDDDIHEGGFGQQCERCHVVSAFKNVKIRF